MAPDTVPRVSLAPPVSIFTRQAAVGWSCETGLVSDLLVRCGRDDQGALALLYDLLAPIVAAAVSMSVSPTRVGDGVRDVFVEMWRDAPGYSCGEVSSIEWIMDRVATVSGRLGVRDSPDRPDRHGHLADAG